MFTVGPWAGGGYWLKLVNLDTEADRVSATNSYFLIPLSLQLDGVNLLYFKLRLFNLTEFIV